MECGGRRPVSDLSEAETQATTIAKNLHQRESRVVQLRGTNCTAYLQAMADLALIQIPLELAAHEYRLAHDLLRGRASVLGAVRFFC